jgi:hypothetical protein
MKKRKYFKLNNTDDIKALRENYDDNDQFTVKNNGEKVTIPDLLFFWDDNPLTVYIDY